MTRRNGLLQAMAVVFVSIFSTQAHAEPATAPVYFAVEKLNLWPTRYFTLTDSDGSKTVAMAEKVLSAEYTFYNASYAPFAQATSAWSLDGRTLFFAGGVLQVADKTGNAIGTLRGNYFTWHRAEFALEDTVGTTLAVATLNSRGNAMVVVDSARPMRTLARLDRQSGGGAGITAKEDSWTVSIYDDAAVPRDMLRTLATYMIDYQDWILWSHFYLPTDDVAATVRNKGVDMGAGAVLNAGVDGAKSLVQHVRR